MYKLVDGKMVAMTEAEIREHNAQVESDSLKAEALERKRPFSEAEITNMIIKAQINTLSVDDKTALRMLAYYPLWEDLCKEKAIASKAGYKFTHKGKLYKTKQDNYTFVAHYEPDKGTEALFEVINEEYSGDKYEPIPYSGNMALENGKYYIENNIIYYCIRDTGNPVYNPLKELVGLYVELV